MLVLCLLPAICVYKKKLIRSECGGLDGKSRGFSLRRIGGKWDMG